MTGKEGQRDLNGRHSPAPCLKSEEHTSHKVEMVVSYSASFLGRCSLEIGGSNLMLSTGCVYWVLLSLEPPPTTGYPSLYCSVIWGHTFRRHLPVLPFHTVVVSKEKDGLNQGSSSEERKYLLCVKFLLSYTLQFLLPVVISNESIQSQTHVSTKSKLLLSVFFFLKKKANDPMML